MLITENQLDEWVRGNTRIAQGTIVELVWRLVAASSPGPKERRFPLGDSIGQHGPDGVLDARSSFEPFVPEGKSYWEIGTGIKARDKATSDYNDLTLATHEDERHNSTFVFVTPLSGRRDWEYSWNEEAQIDWTDRRKKAEEWKDVRVIDGTKLIDWLNQFLAVEIWLADRMGLPVNQFEALDLRWETLRAIGDHPPLTPRIFLEGREDACCKIKGLFAKGQPAGWVRFETYFPEQVPDFAAAYLGSLDGDARLELAGRCLIVTSPEAWDEICRQYRDCILIAKPAVGLSGEEGAIIFERARMAGHSVIYSALPGSTPDVEATSFPQPTIDILARALAEGGYSEEKAQLLAHRSGGNPGFLVNLIQKTSSSPAWAHGPNATDLAISVLLGSWDENNQSDCKIIETLSGKKYSEWIVSLRGLAHSSGNPVTCQSDIWRFTSLYRGWYALGPLLYREHLQRFSEAAVIVLREINPKYELPAEQRFAAQVYGKVPTYSSSLQKGLAESLALIGSQSKALTNFTKGGAEDLAALTVREILDDADWVRWASLNEVLPLLAEAAPGEFLAQVEATLQRDPCPFNDLFAQESSGFFGSTYLSGLLWSLETLAWDSDCLVRVIFLLGELAALDPGGNWKNRPINSIRAILLPWLPQTCAPIAKRLVAVNALLQGHPDVAWKVLLRLLPEKHGMSDYTRKPVWREIIPENWSGIVTRDEYWRQSISYSELAVKTAKDNNERLVEIVGHLDDLPVPAREQLLTFLESTNVLERPEDQRFLVWTALVTIVIEHRKYADADWAMEPPLVDRINAIAERLAPGTPQLHYGRLFSDFTFSLYRRKGDYQEKELEDQREKAVRDIFEAGGLQAVFDFSLKVNSPEKVGFALGSVASAAPDSAIIPVMLESQRTELVKFAGGFVWGRFCSLKWTWVDGLDLTDWTKVQIGLLLDRLPFGPEAWERSARLLGEDESPYWSRTNANPYQTDGNLELAIDKLLKYGRPRAAVRCIHRKVLSKQAIDSRKITQALLASIGSLEAVHSTDDYEVMEIIRALQDDPKTNQDDLFRAEWAFLPLLDRTLGASPKLLERQLSTDPDFFCELIRLVFKSRNGDCPTIEPTEQEKKMATNAYRLLNGWRIPPGSREDVGFDGNALVSWLNAVRTKCEETGHLTVALHMVGHVLAYAPLDPEGLWIHRDAAAVLNAEDSKELREGFRLELFNSGGAHIVDPTGKAENEIVAKYRNQAEEVEAAGFFRLASTIKELAEEHLRAAERISCRLSLD